MQLGVLALVVAVSVLGGGTAAGVMAQASGGSPMGGTMGGTMGGGMGGMHGGGMMGDGNCDVGHMQNHDMNCEMQKDHDQCRAMMS